MDKTKFEAQTRAMLARVTTETKIAPSSSRTIKESLPLEVRKNCDVFAVAVSHTAGSPRVSYAPANDKTSEFYAHFYSVKEWHVDPPDAVVYVACNRRDTNPFKRAPVGVLHAANWLVFNASATDYTREKSITPEHLWVLTTHKDRPFGGQSMRDKVDAFTVRS